jgi:putative aldouronate transport system permease protein
MYKQASSGGRRNVVVKTVSDVKIGSRGTTAKPIRLTGQFSRQARLQKYAGVYALLIIPVIYLVVYRYIPIILQILIAFKDYKISKGIFGSEWTGLGNFRELFAIRDIGRVIRNTVVISLLRLIFGFFPPIILSIFLYDLHFTKLRRVSQTILYIPHFFSWVIIYSIAYSLFTKTGIINSIIVAVGGEAKDFLVSSSTFRPMIIVTGIWKEVGWGTIIYLAAMSNLDPGLFDAAKIDGAGPLQRIRHITLPGIRGVVIFLLTLAIGRLFQSTGVEQILLFYSPPTYEVGDVIGTWVYRQGLTKLQYSLGTSLAFIESVFGLVLILSVNYIAKKRLKVGLW